MSSQTSRDGSDSESHSSLPRRRQAFSPQPSNSTISTQSISKAMNDDQRRMYEAKLAIARSAGRLNANLKAEIEVVEGKRTMGSRMNRPQRAAGQQNEHELVLGESALEIINLFKVKAEESRQKIHQLKQEVLNAQALTSKYKELYERTRKQKGQIADDEDDSVSRMSVQQQSLTAETSSISTASTAIANLRKRGVNFELEFERLQIKHQTLVHENEKLKAEIQRLKTDNQQLIVKVRRSEEEQREAMNKYAASEAARNSLEKRLEHEKKQHQTLLLTVRKQTADWILEQRQQQQLDEEDKWNSIIPADDRHSLRPRDKTVSQSAANNQAHSGGSVVSHATGLSTRASDKSSMSRSTMSRAVSQRKA